MSLSVSKKQNTPPKDQAAPDFRSLIRQLESYRQLTAEAQQAWDALMHEITVDDVAVSGSYTQRMHQLEAVYIAFVDGYMAAGGELDL